jgi:hypothetical protein
MARSSNPPRAYCDLLRLGKLPELPPEKSLRVFDRLSDRTCQKEGGDQRAFTQYGVSPGEAKAVSIYYKIKEEKR